VLLTAALGDRCALAGAAGGFEAIVLKESAPDELVDCIKAVVIGMARRSPGSLSARPAGHPTATEASLRSACALTGRERAVVSGVVRALSNKQIARDLALSEGTIKATCTTYTRSSTSRTARSWRSGQPGT
jgi:DNA-binding NarL/FixJ family response regulator